GSLIERSPFALLPGLWGGGALAVYRAVAVPCLLAAAVIAVVLVAGMRAEGKPRLARGVVLALLVANPISLLALETGHPEELLAAGPVLLALPPSRRLLCCAAAFTAAALIEAPLLIAATGTYLHASRVAAAPGSGIFQPWQLWWFFGHHGPLVHGLFGAAKPG